jgi:hypothetical protein
MAGSAFQAVSEACRPLRPCLGCGAPGAGSHCSECQPRRKSGNRKSSASSSARGYDSSWRRLSLAARAAQGFCTDCGTKDDLTGDHLRWPARLPTDVDVVCRSCNSKRGALRGSDA